MCLSYLRFKARKRVRSHLHGGWSPTLGAQPERDASICTMRDNPAEAMRGMRPRTQTTGTSGTMRWQVEESVEHTGDDLGALKVLVGVQVARRQGEPQPDEDQKEVRSPPHGRFTSRVATAARETGASVC